MGIDLIIMLVLGLAATFATIGSTISTNRDNVAMQKQTNEQNIAMQREINASNVEQSELAYKRSQPVAQISDMLRSGISLPAAISKISGGGSYQLPSLSASTSQSPHVDYSGIGAAFENLRGIPAGVMQSRMQNQQLASIQQSMEIEKQRALQDKEKHDLEIWNMKYGKELAQRRDAFNSKLSVIASNRNIDWNTITNKQQLIDKFGLQYDKDWLSLPKSIQDDFANDAIARAVESRATQSQSNQNRAAVDAHRAAEDALKTAKINREKLRKEIDDFDASKDAREQEYSARSINAQLRKLADECGLSDLEYKTALKYVRDAKTGKLKPEELSASYLNVADGFDAFWNGLFKIIPLKSLSKSLLGGLINLGS